MADDFVSKFVLMFEQRKRDLKNFILSLRKSLTCFEYIDSWGKYNKTSLPSKEKFYSKLKSEGMAYGGYTQRVNHTHKMKNVGVRRI